MEYNGNDVDHFWVISLQINPLDLYPSCFYTVWEMVIIESIRELVLRMAAPCTPLKPLKISFWDFTQSEYISYWKLLCLWSIYAASLAATLRKKSKSFLLSMSSFKFWLSSWNINHLKSTYMLKSKSVMPTFHKSVNKESGSLSEIMSHFQVCSLAGILKIWWIKTKQYFSFGLILVKYFLQAYIFLLHELRFHFI